MKERIVEIDDKFQFFPESEAHQLVRFSETPRNSQQAAKLDLISGQTDWRDAQIVEDEALRQHSFFNELELEATTPVEDKPFDLIYFSDEDDEDSFSDDKADDELISFPDNEANPKDDDSSNGTKDDDYPTLELNEL